MCCSAPQKLLIVHGAGGMSAFLSCGAGGKQGFKIRIAHEILNLTGLSGRKLQLGGGKVVVFSNFL